MTKRSRLMFARAQIEQTDSRIHTEALIELGNCMVSEGLSKAPDTSIPAAYTYFGQFVNHDLARLVFTNQTDALVRLASPTEQIRNLKDERLRLCSIYDAPAQTQGDSLVLGKTAPIGRRIQGKDAYHDLPRRGTGGAKGRSAIIGDPRNDDNLVIAQLHVAFMRAHNSLVRRGAAFEEARETLCDIYSRIVFSDYLPRILDPDVWTDIVSNGPRYLDRASEGECYIPLEFSLAAFRFGHSMIRSSYSVNSEFPNASLRLMMQASGGRGDLFGLDRLIRNWVIDWKRFLPDARGYTENCASCIDTNVIDPLSAFVAPTPSESEERISLAAKDLLRGYSAGLVCGQIAAEAVNAHVLQGQELLTCVSDRQAAVLSKHDLEFKTPLWFYVLAEAAAQSGGAGKRLGPVGSRIVGETLFRVLQQDAEEASVRTLAARPAELAMIVALSEASD